jgi:hypothetical protein
MLNNQHTEFNDITDEITWKLSNDGFDSAKLIRDAICGAGRLVDLKKEDGKIVEFASVAIKCKNRRTTSSSNVVSPLGCGAP